MPTPKWVVQSPAAVGAARLQFAEGLLNQIKQMPEADQMQVMRDLATRADTSISRSYGYFSVNTKLAWYELAKLMKGHCCSHTDWL